MERTKAGPLEWHNVRDRLPRPGDVAGLVRLPAALTVPGDVLLGAVAGGRPITGRTVLLCGSSCSLYLAGMALNDWADEEVDARERPGRPIPSGRVTPGFALGLSAFLTATGVAVAAAAGGQEAVAVAVPLAGAVWAYDLALKSSALGPLSMASCRALDVLVGAGAGRNGLRHALPAAAVIGAHTAMVSAVSRHEASGADASVARRALRATVAVTGAAGALAVTAARRRRAPVLRMAAAAGLLTVYVTRLLQAERVAVADPSPAALQKVVGTGVLGLMPLEAGLLAAAGPLPAAGAVAAAWPLAGRLARRRAVT